MPNSCRLSSATVARMSAGANTHAARYRLIPSLSMSRPFTRGSKLFGEMIGVLPVRNHSTRTRRRSHSSSVIGSVSGFMTAPVLPVTPGRLSVDQDTRDRYWTSATVAPLRSDRHSASTGETTSISV